MNEYAVTALAVWLMGYTILACVNIWQSPGGTQTEGYFLMLLWPLLILPAMIVVYQYRRDQRDR